MTLSLAVSSAIMLSVTLFDCYVECRYAECRFAECHSAQLVLSGTDTLSIFVPCL
jgi:hypothetical protein